MRVLLVNKFLYPKGGAESYVIRLGKKFEDKGNQVEYFGINDQKNILKNKYNLYAESIDLRKTSIKNIFKAKEMIYSKDAYKKIFQIFEQYRPDLTILNNIEYYLTPSIIDAYKKYKNNFNPSTKLFYVAHDYQIVCPNHGLFDKNINPCEKCLNGNYWNCFLTKCHKNSRAKSLIATIDSIYWHRKDTYDYVDKFICPSNFMKTKLDTNKKFTDRTVVLHNFVDKVKAKNYEKEDYILYFGKLCKDKGVDLLLEVAKELPDIKFIFAGYGPAAEKINKIKNCEFVGFKEGKELQEIIEKARLSICPSECYENCPFSVIESQMYGTPVLGANIGGIPELIDIGRTGDVFEAKNKNELKKKIEKLWNNKEALNEYSKNCLKKEVITIGEYYNNIIKLYEEEK